MKKSYYLCLSCGSSQSMASFHLTDPNVFRINTTSEQNKIYPQFILVQRVLKMFTELHSLTVSLAIAHKLSSYLVMESGTRNVVLPTLLYQMYCQDLGPLHLLIFESKIDSCFCYAHHFCSGKQISDVEEQKLLYTFLIADTWYQKLFSYYSKNSLTFFSYFSHQM